MKREKNQAYCEKKEKSHMGILSGRGSLSRGITSFRLCGKGFAAFCFACLQHVVQGLQKRGVLHRPKRRVASV